MIKINLLPVKASRRQDAVKRELVFAGLGLVGLLGVCTVLFVIVGAQASELSAENAQLNKDIENLKAIVARVDEVDRLKQDLRTKLDVIAELKASKSGPVHMLDELSSATPEKLQLHLVSEKSRKLDIEGLAVSNEVISQFLSNLERSDWFRDVYLVGIDQVEQDGYKLKSFNVTARAVIPSSKAEAAEGEEE
jgi:type IV pilus assembly protein PilN